MSQENGAKWQVIMMIFSALITIWLSGLTAGVINNYYRSEDKVSEITSDANSKYALIIERLTRIETKVDRIDR